MKLIPQWRSWWKFSSTWFHATAAAFLSYVTLVPDALIQLWNFLPVDLKSAVPPQYAQFIAVGLIVLGLFARLVKQPALAQPGDVAAGGRDDRSADREVAPAAGRVLP